MNASYLLLTAAGIGVVAWGLPAAHRLKNPFDLLASLAVLAGVTAALTGVLLTVLPNFFRG